MILERLLSKKLLCSTCKGEAVFLKVEDVECDYGTHTLIQCPLCQELFSIDGPCNAFQNLLYLLDVNHDILTKNEIELYRLSAHACNMN